MQDTLAGIVELTLLVAAQGVILAFPPALASALLLSRGGGGIAGGLRVAGLLRTLLDVAVHLPLVLPPVVIGWGLLLTFGSHAPVGAWLLHRFGLRLVFTRAGAALATAVMVLPLMMRAMRQSLQALDPGIVDAARTLGAGPVDRLVSVVLPLIAPGLLSAVVIGFAAALGEFGAVITFAASIPGQTQTLPLAIFAALQDPQGDALAARLSLVSAGLAVGLLLVAAGLERWLHRRLGA